MKRVAILAPDFAPSSMPPALRVRLFVTHLAAFGWQPTVITTQPRHYEWTVDPENERLLPAGLRVIRTGAFPPGLARKLGFGDIGLRTLWPQWRALARLCRRRQVDLVFVSGPPFMPMALARLAHLRYGVPYVVDYIDPWISEYDRQVPRAQRPRKWIVAYGLARAVEPFVLRRAAHLTGVSAGTTAGMIARYPWLRPADATEIPYGGEPGDFAYLAAHPRRNPVFDPADGLLHLSYVGVIIPAMHGVLRALFAAVRRGRESDPVLFGRLRLHFVGTTYIPDAAGRYQVLPLAAEEGVAELVAEHPPRLPYLDATQILLDSHGLLLIGSDVPHYTASKLFPYILARRPLLALFHEASTVVTMLHETGAGDVITFSPAAPIGARVPAIADCLAAMLARPPGWAPPTRWDAFARYTARAMTARLAEVFDRALEARR